MMLSETEDCEII